MRRRLRTRFYYNYYLFINNVIKRDYVRELRALNNDNNNDNILIIFRLTKRING